MKLDDFESELYNYCVQEGIFLAGSERARQNVRFICRCLFNDYNKERLEKVKNLVGECGSVSELISTILNDCPDYVNGQAYGEISKIFPNHDARIMSMVEKYNAENDL